MDQTWLYVIGTVATLSITIGLTLIGFVIGITSRVTRLETEQKNTDNTSQKVESSLSEWLNKVEGSLAVGLARIETELRSVAAHHEKEIDGLRENYHRLGGTVQAVQAKSDVIVSLVADGVMKSRMGNG